MKMRNIYFCLLGIFCVMAASWRGDEAVRCYRIRKGHPSAGNVIFMYPDDNIVCYCGDLVLFSVMTRYDSLINHKPHSAGVWHFYLVYRKGDTTGILYDLDHNTFRRNIPVAQALQHEWFTTFNAYDFFKNRHTLVSTSKEDDAQHGFSETYKLMADSLHVHVIFHYSDQYKAAPFSLSRELDSIKGSKLYYVELFGPLPGVVDSATAERVPLMTYGLEEVDSTAHVRPYFERFAKDAAGGR